jgi:hypothetical protein
MVVAIKLYKLFNVQEKVLAVKMGIYFLNSGAECAAITIEW